MSGCDRCGHRKKDHLPLCIVLITNGHSPRFNRRACLCPQYLKPGTMR